MYLLLFQVHEFSSLLKFYDFRNFITFSRTLMPDYQMGLYSEFESALNYKLPKGDTQKGIYCSGNLEKRATYFCY